MSKNWGGGRRVWGMKFVRKDGRREEQVSRKWGEWMKRMGELDLGGEDGGGVE